MANDLNAKTDKLVISILYNTLRSIQTLQKKSVKRNYAKIGVILNITKEAKVQICVVGSTYLTYLEKIKIQ